jgi:hypothetical protein
MAWFPTSQDNALAKIGMGEADGFSRHRQVRVCSSVLRAVRGHGSSSYSFPIHFGLADDSRLRQVC